MPTSFPAARDGTDQGTPVHHLTSSRRPGCGDREAVSCGRSQTPTRPTGPQDADHPALGTPRPTRRHRNTRLTSTNPEGPGRPADQLVERRVHAASASTGTQNRHAPRRGAAGLRGGKENGESQSAVGILGCSEMTATGETSNAQCGTAVIPGPWWLPFARTRWRTPPSRSAPSRSPTGRSGCRANGCRSSRALMR